MDRKTKLKFYFVLRDAAANYTGYSKIEMHLFAKNKIFPLMYDEEENFMLSKYTMKKIINSNDKELSLDMLSDKGLDTFVEAFKVICNDYYNFIL